MLWMNASVFRPYERDGAAPAGRPDRRSSSCERARPMPSREISLVFHSPEGGQIGAKAIRQTLEDDRVPGSGGPPRFPEPLQVRTA